jgi:predicted transcriptional regulator
MSSIEIPTEVKDFVFHNIDSVEQLEILLILHADSTKWWSSEEISGQLRSNRNSVEKRVQFLIKQKLVVVRSEDSKYSFQPADPRAQHTVDLLSEAYRVQKYRILEIIFSPMKRSRDFADAFKIANTKEDKGDRNG